MSVRLKQLAQDGAADGQLIAWNASLGKWVPSTNVDGPNFVTDTIPGEVVTGTDTVLATALTQTPVAGSVKLHLNGVLQKEGAGNKYTVSGTSVTWLAATGTAVDLDATDEILVAYSY